MKTVDHLLSEELISALGWTLIHALWQGALFAIILGIVLVLTHSYSSKSRYFIAVIAFGLFASATLVTFSVLYNPKDITLVQAPPLTEETPLVLEREVPASTEVAVIEAEQTPVIETSHKTNLLLQARQYFSQHLPLIVTLWMLGVVVLLLRFLGSLAYIQRLRSYRTELLPASWLAQGERLKEQLKLKKKVAFLASYKVLTPLAIGIFRPAILLPAQLLSGLSQQQVEAILLHELAHIKRNDYLVNVLQTLIDILFFYHPAIWWMSATIRNERENCCDDMVIAITGETGNYARTLILLKEQEINPKLPAMAFTGIKYKFNDRIKRLFNQPTVFADFREGFVTAMILVVGLFTIAVNAFGTPSFLQLNEVAAIVQEEEQDSPPPAETLQEIPNPATAENAYTPRDSEELEEEREDRQEEEYDNSIEILPGVPAEENSELDLLLGAIDDGNMELVQFMLDKGAKVNAATKDGWTPLMEAADEGHMEIVKLLLDKGANINASTKSGYTPLMVAVDEGYGEVAKYLIQKGAKVDAKTKNGWDVFMEAIDEGHIDIVRMLLDQGANVNRVYGHHTPLMEAIDEGHMDIAKLLMEKGADPNKGGNDGYTPLMEAADAGDPEIVKLLLDRGADIKATNKHGWNAFLEAIDEGHIEIVKLLLSKGMDVNTVYGHHTPLMEAIDEGHMEMVKLLLDNGADVNKGGDNGYTPLMEAIDEENVEIAELLLSRGAKVNAQTSSGHTALMEAADEGNLAITRLLLNKGAKPSAQGHSGWSAFLEAIDEGHLDLVKLYVEQGADVNEANEHGHTPLMEAADEGHVDIVQYLLQKGADVNLPTESGHSPLTAAIDDGRTAVVKLLVENGADINGTSPDAWTPLLEAVDEGHIDIVQYLINKGADVNRTKENGYTPLMEAADEGQLEIASILIKEGADINAKADLEWTHFDSNKMISRIQKGWTALFEAVHEEEEEIVRLLLDNGANVNETVSQIVYNVKTDKRQEHQGWTPLMEAVENNHLPSVKLLVQRKADINARTSNGLSVLELAKEHGSKELINFISARAAR
ncbi:MAG: ankyrin repeat domain-containing protein [Saprospiraceae bacterium]|nr:ankyrin repeat domain-containing protein [Saprospiraceae bacterium]